MISVEERVVGGDTMKKSSASCYSYNSSLVQVILTALVCFCTIGMIRALFGMGGGGQRDPTAANNANTAIYATFAFSGVLSGGLFNVLGPRLMFPAGCMGTVLLTGSFLYYNHYQNEAFLVVSGVIAGIGAGFLSAVQGAVMTSYPPPHRKGMYISLFWVIFSSGGVVGGLVPFILNFHRPLDSVNDATYIAFMCFMATGTLISLAVLPPSQVYREDGSQCTLHTNQHSKFSTEAIEILKLFGNWKMLLIAPAAWASNFFYAYEFNNVNAAQFNLRTRGLNNVSYWGAQMVGSILIGYVFDFGFRSRRRRGFLGIGTVCVIGTLIWGGGLVNQLGYSFHDTPYPKLDFIESGDKFVGPFVLYFSYGLFDAIFQSMIYWVIGALADDTETLSRYAGFYKGMQSAGAAVAWQLDARKVPMLTQLVVNWSLTTISYPLLAILVALAVVDEQIKNDF
ncbi:UNC93-like protein 2 [Linum grandiflorum]